MIYLIWRLFNVGLLLVFIVIALRATSFVREKMGLLAAILFVIGLLSFVGHSGTGHNKQNTLTNQAANWSYKGLDSINRHPTVFKQVELEKTPISEFNIGILYTRDEHLQSIIPFSAHSFVNGFVSGTTWNPISVSVNRTDDPSAFEYEVYGAVKWSILGWTIYSQQKKWKGIAILK